MHILQKKLPRPVRNTRSKAILPLFLPFAGCPEQCVFCAQDKQSGGGEAVANIVAMQQNLELRAQLGEQNLEIAFYGGTFTALPHPLLASCLELYKKFATQGLLSHARCSTRPDCLGFSTAPATKFTSIPGIAALEPLLPLGFDCIELGVQSFSTHALQVAKRGYNAECAHNACQAVKAHGFALGIQLLPGMPGVTPEVFLEDVRLALEHAPALLRFYPCLVPKNTALAAWWKQGSYTPWDLPTTVHTLGQALALAWEAGVPVARLSLAPEKDFDSLILAGPHHPALGNMIQAEAVEILVDNANAALSEEAALLLNVSLAFPYIAPDILHKMLHIPAYFQGFFWGHKGAKKATWAERGFFRANIVHRVEEFSLIWMIHDSENAN